MSASIDVGPVQLFTSPEERALFEVAECVGPDRAVPTFGQPDWVVPTWDQLDWGPLFDAGNWEGTLDLPADPAQYINPLEPMPRESNPPAPIQPSPPSEEAVQWRDSEDDAGLSGDAAPLSARDSADESKKGPSRPTEKVSLSGLSATLKSNANTFQIRKPKRVQKKVKEYKNPQTAAFKKFEAEELAADPEAFGDAWFARQPPPKKKRNNYRQPP
ncbi:hypothetical protein FQN50_005103 [Emmonsiellopsis sp. PD_5]|nr:hypothetical protein FQN50_005103 [Emmonsiellopsis sp. PD_5]